MDETESVSSSVDMGNVGKMKFFSSFRKLVLDKKWIAGISFIFAMAFFEPVSFGNKMGDMPPYFTSRILIRAFPMLENVSMLYLLVPSLIFAIIAFLPVLERKFDKAAFVIVLAGFLYFPLTIFCHNAFPYAYGYILWFLFIFYMGINLWLKSVNYFYSSAIAAVFWDLGAALLAFSDRVPIIGVPYCFKPGLKPIVIIIIDLTGITIFFFLWLIKFNLIKRWNLFETYD